ncbi:MAG: hypothetical protein C5B50_14795 [Verrucomicrobia bacterium]|nr:MAG: hypothetical protein C5B50_14795 [Verrucomicrobiota bacterium]
MSQQENQAKDYNWPKDEFTQREMTSFWGLIIGVGLVIVLTLVLSLVSFSMGSGFVIAYCAQDQVYAEPIFQDFEKETGIKVRAVYDNEAVKTVGLANRLLAERNHPQCDVFWGNEEMRTRQLAAQNIFGIPGADKAVRAPDGWAAFGHRSRRIVINTNHLSLASAPHSLLELTNTAWRGKVALAYPQFGTTATHFHALRQLWGDQSWQTWCRALAANKPFLVDGNSVVVKLVGRGEAWIGLTDSDDIAEGQHNGLPIIPLPITSETLLIPNTVALVRNAPHPDSARRLFDYLQQPKIVQGLVSVGALEDLSGQTGEAFGVRSRSIGSALAESSEAKQKRQRTGALQDAAAPTLTPDWPALLRDLDSTTTKLNEIFLR